MHRDGATVESEHLEDLAVKDNVNDALLVTSEISVIRLSELFVQFCQALFFELHKSQFQLFQNFWVITLRSLLRVEDF